MCVPWSPAKYIDLSTLAPNYLRWEDAPADVVAAVKEKPDDVLMANIVGAQPGCLVGFPFSLYTFKRNACA